MPDNTPVTCPVCGCTGNDDDLAFAGRPCPSLDDNEEPCTGIPMPVWEDEDHPRYTCDIAIVNGHRVSVCLDDEGPIRPAFYWDIDDRTVDGWDSTVEQAKVDAVEAANLMEAR